MDIMTQEEYLKSPNQCPVCRSTHIAGGHVDISGGSAVQTVVCNDCDASWDDVYSLTGFNLFNNPKEST